MDAPRSGRRPRRGFTLIEMLAVVVIIGILAALITAAALAAVKRAKNARIKLEIDQIDMALKECKNKFGDYPPDFTDAEAVRRFLKMAFPRCPASNYPDFGDLPNAQYNPGSALVFWLGMPDPNNPKKMIGFSANPRNPFDNSPARLPPLFEFDQRRLELDSGGALVYYPDTGVQAGTAANPYIYFRARNGAYDPSLQNYQNSAVADSAVAKPYYDETAGPNGDWVNPKTFQIICAGLDNDFGNGTSFPHGEGGDNSIAYEQGNFDNITNFSNVTLEDQMP